MSGATAVSYCMDQHNNYYQYNLQWKRNLLLTFFMDLDEKNNGGLEKKEVQGVP